jgi:hypothetical protein
MRKDSKVSMLLFAVVTSCLPLCAQKLTQECSEPSFPAAATAIDSACGVAGSGGKETAQNTAKNNFCGQGQPEGINFDKLKQLQLQVGNDHSIPFGQKGTATRHPGPATQRGPLQSMGEGNAVVLNGFVLKARQEGGESVNCGSAVPDNPAYHDIHVALVANDTEKDECNAIVVEMSPHHRPAEWTAENVNKVAGVHAPIRVSGQLFFDSSHSPCQNGLPSSGDPKRFSLWEIHPIYNFEVCTGDCTGAGTWESLADWTRTH